MTCVARITDEDRTIHLQVEGVPDMPVRFTKMTISPSWLRITCRWTARTGLYYIGVDVGGARRLKSGDLGTGASDGGLGSSDWPEWMAALVAEHTPAEFTR